MNIANLNKNNTKMPFKQLSFILTILLLLFTFSFACSPAVNPTDNNDEKTVFTPSLHIKVSDGSTDITESLSIGVDENDSTKIIISGLVNSIGADKTYTLSIAPVADLFSTEGDITIAITEPTGFSPGDVVPSPNGFTITNVSDPDSSIRYTVVVSFSGALVGDWFDTSYIEADFASQAASLELIGNTLSVNDLLNAESGTGSISITNLPKGFEAIPESITLPDPDGTATVKITLDPNTFTISETGNPDNSQEYTIGEITFEAITVFTPSQHITITDNSITDPTPNDITTTVNTDNQITITGLSNAVGENKEYTLTINSVEDLFSTGNSPITITIRDPDGFSPGGGLLSQGNGDPSSSVSFTITNDIDPSTSITYTVEVQFSGAAIADWLTTETEFRNYFTGATFSGQTLDSTLDNTVLSFNFDGDSDRYIIAIDGSSISNLQNGILRLTTIDDMPEGYTLTQNLNDPDQEGVAALSDAPAGKITIAEEDNTDNTKEYTVTISLAAYISPVMAAQISVTGFDGSSIVIDPSNIDIQQNIITISALANGTSGTGTVTITPPTTLEYTVEPDSLTFDDPPGTDMAELTVGTVNIASALGTVSHTVKLNLAAYSSRVDASHVMAEFNGITADPTNIEISGTDIIIRGFPNIAGSTTEGSVSITPPTDGYTMVPDSFSRSFNDPAGTDSEDLRIEDVVSVTSAGVIALHTIIIKFSSLISLKITSDNVVSNPLTITSGGIVTITNLGACELLPSPTFEIVENTSATVRGFPSYFDRRKDSPTGSHPYTVNRVLIIEDGGDVLDDTFTVSITGFQECDDGDIFTNSGKTGDDADTAYEIDSAPKLELLSHLVSSDNANYASKFYKLTDDIDLGLAGLPWSEDASGETGEGFPPIGVTDTNFKGKFDCANNSISNLYINKATSNDIGLFGSTAGASIQNCSLINVNVSGRENVGGLAGILKFYSRITNSDVTGDVEGTNNVGGLVGNLYFTSSVTDSNATDSVSGATDSDSGNGNVGGLVGLLSLSSTITNSYATGSVSGNDYIGGLAGRIDGSYTTNSYATGSVSGNDDLGGLAGFVDNSSTITNSYVTGSVSGNDNVGGLVGRLSVTSSITNSYATGSVSGFTDVGGFAGSVDSSSTITNSYWDTVTSKQDTSAGAGDGAAMGRTTDDLKRGSAGEDIFTGWLSAVWKFAPDTVYPRLKMVVCANRQYPADPSNVPTDCTALQ